MADITLKFGVQGDNNLKTALSVINSELKNLDAEMKYAAEQMKRLDDTEEKSARKAELLQKQYEVNKEKLAILTGQYETSRDRLGQLAEKLEEAKTQFGDNSKEVQKLKDEYGKQVKATTDLETAMTKTKTEMEKAKNEMDALGDSAEESGKDAEKASEGYTVFKGVVADLTATAIKKAIDGLKKMAYGLVNIGKAAYGGYAEYEQLIGGVETLFGDSADELVDYANVAYKSAGMSANEYMSTATSFSASLLQGLKGDTAEAVKYADKAIIDMSDNANKMGTDISMIQSAYQGFAKQNYTMLDNLKLGYGGTASEMARLVNDSKVLGENTEVTAQTVKDVPFDQIIEAIHRTQEQMGITGTTSREAAETIEGSTKSMKGAWQNLVVGIADENADLKKLTSDFGNSVITVAQNAIPRIKQIFSGMKEAFKLALQESAPEVGKTLLPALETIGTTVKKIAGFVIENFRTIAEVVGIAAGAFVAYKTAMAVAGLIDAVTKATEGMTIAQAALNAVMNVNPYVLLATALGAIIAAVAIFSDDTPKVSEDALLMQESIGKLAAEVDEASAAFGRMEEAKQTAIAGAESEAAYYEGLLTELDSIVDANGKVKEGYEERANVITTTLSEAFGVEMDASSGIIKNYQKMTEEVKRLIATKKGEAILKAQTEAYSEAIAKRADAEIRLAQLTSERDAAEKALSDAEAERTRFYEERTKRMHDVGWEAFLAEEESWNRREQNLNAEIDLRKQNASEAIRAYDEQMDKIAAYDYNITQYEQNQLNLLEGNIDKMSTISYEAVKSYDTLAPAAKKAFDDVYGATIDAATEAYNAAYKTASNIAAGFQKGISDNSYKMTNSVATASAAATRTMQTTFQVKSPSRVTEQIGRYFAEGFEVGVDKEERSAVNTVRSFGQATINALKARATGQTVSTGATVSTVDGATAIQTGNETVVVKLMLDGREIATTTNNYNAQWRQAYSG